MNKKIVCGILLLSTILLVFYLATQAPQDTMRLSETVRTWAVKAGYQGGALEFRSDIHIVEYLFVGLISVMFARIMSWKAWTGALIAFGVGLIEECVKIFLPTREFGAKDLLKDAIGIVLGMCLVVVVEKLIRRN